MTKQDNKTLEELVKKSKKDIIIFLNQRKDEENNLDSQKLNIKYREKNIETQKLNQDIQKIKSVFTPQILEQNSDIADEFKKLDTEKDNEKKDKILEKILALLKNPKILKSITDQL